MRITENWKTSLPNMTTRRKKLWLTVKMGRGSIDAMVTASHASKCNSCGREIWWGVRRDDPQRKIPLEQRWHTEQGQKKVSWFAHHIFCPVNGVLVKKTGQTPLF